jgi:TPR repeat protein
MDNIYVRIPALRKIDSYGCSKYAQELRRLLPAANDWDAEAQYRAGQILAEGFGSVPLDLFEGAKWIDLAARKSHEAAVEAQQRMIDTHGWDVVGEGKRRGFRWQQELYNAEAGWPPEAPEEIMTCVDEQSPIGARYAFGSFLNDGDKMPFDYEKSFRFFLLGAELDDCMHCTFNVGHAYHCGKGIKADPVQATRWLTIASNRRYAKATFLLAIMAMRGHGIAKDKDVALGLFREAEQQGHPDATRVIAAIHGGATLS